MVSFRVSFNVDLKTGSGVLAQSRIREYIVDSLAKSIIIQELKVSVVKVNGQEFNLEEIRNRDRRF